MGAHMAEADSTGWMAMYCLNLLRIALELALHDPAYESIASKFFEHFLAIAETMNHVGCRAVEEGGIGMWDDELEWYCSIAELPDGRAMRLKSFSMVNLIPLFAVETLEPQEMARAAGIRRAPAMAGRASQRPGPPGGRMDAARRRPAPSGRP